MNASKEISMNSRTKISLISGIRQIFQESFKCLPFVFKKTTLNFASIWFPLAILCIVTMKMQFPDTSSGAPIEAYITQILKMGLNLIGHCFIIFIVPYYVFVFLNKKKNKSTVNFWDFLSENMFPLVVNHIKTTFTIICFILLLIIPGIIKALQLALVTQATFFDEDYKNDKISALKASKQTTKGFLTGILLLIGFTLTLHLISKPLFSILKIVFSEQMIPVVFIDVAVFLTTFYISCFSLILMTQTYFVLKQYNQ